MARSQGFKIVVNLSNFFNDHRHRARIFVNSSIQTVHDLQEKISGVFGIENFYLSTQNEFLPPFEDVRILQHDEILWVHPVKSDEQAFKQSQSDIAISSKKYRKQRKAKLKIDEHQSSEESWIPKKCKKYVEIVEHVSDTDEKSKKFDEYLGEASLHKKKKLKKDEPPLSSQINEAVNEELKKKKKKYNKSADTEMEPVENSNFKIISDRKTNTSKEIAKNEDTDEGFKKNKLIYTKNSPLPTITEQYLKQKKINIVKIDYVVGNPPSNIPYKGDKQESNEIMEDETTENLVEKQNEIATPVETLPETIIKSNNNEMKIDGDDSRDKLSLKKEYNAQTESLQDNDNHLIDAQEISPAQFVDAELGNDPIGNCETKNGNLLRKKKFFFFHSPSLKDICVPIHSNMIKAPETFDENGKQIFVQKIFKHPPNFTTTMPSQEKESEKINSLNDNFPDEKTEIVQSTSTKENNEEAIPIVTRTSPTNSIIESNQSVIEDSHEFSDIYLNGTIQLPKDEGDGHNSLGISGIRRISPSPQSKFSRLKNLSGIGSMLEGLRQADTSKVSSLDSNLDSDCSEYVTRRRKRVRKRSKKPRDTPGNSALQPPLQPPPKPMNVKGAPSIHIKFDEEGDAKIEGPAGSDNVEEVKTNEQDILRAPSMSSMKPKVGDIIAFKILKIGTCYQPELSSYITGQVAEYHTNDNQIVFDIISGHDECKEPEGRFSMKQDGDENYNNFQSKRREFNWSDLIEPRLLYP